MESKCSLPHVQHSPPLILSRMVVVILPRTSKIHFNEDPLTHAWISHVISSFQGSWPNSVCISELFHVHYMSRPSQPSVFDHRHISRSINYDVLDILLLRPVSLNSRHYLQNVNRGTQSRLAAQTASILLVASRWQLLCYVLRLCLPPICTEAPRMGRQTRNRSTICLLRVADKCLHSI
jgi:hypothetical protein